VDLLCHPSSVSTNGGVTNSDSDARIKHCGGSQLDGVTTGQKMRLDVLPGCDSSSAHNLKFQSVLMNNAGEKPHLIQNRFSDRFTSDTAALPTEQRAPLLIPNCCCDAIDHD
jgi:hypothetical protein